MSQPQRHVGIDREAPGGMTDSGRIVRNARVFGLIDPSETGARRTPHRIEAFPRIAPAPASVVTKHPIVSPRFQIYSHKMN